MRAARAKTSCVEISVGFLLLAALLTGCGESVTPTSEVTDSPLATPTRGSSSQSPVETLSPALTDREITPAAGKAILRGHITVKHPGIVIGELYLAKAVPTDREDVELLELDEAHSPRAVIDHVTGEFAFIDVDPGRYGLIAWEPQNSFPIEDPDTDETLFVELSAGEVVDVGSLPVP